MRHIRQSSRMGDMAGLPVMSGPDAIVLGEKINKEAKELAVSSII